MARAPSQILALSAPEASSGGTVLSFTLETSSGQLRLRCPSVDIGELLAFFGRAASVIGEATGVTGEPTNDLVPIPATGVGFQAGQTPNTTLMVVNVSGFGVAFEIQSSDLADMADELGQVARTLSVGGQKPQ